MQLFKGGEHPTSESDKNRMSVAALDDNASQKVVVDIPPVIQSPFVLKTYPQAWLALLLLVLVRTAVSVFQFTFSVVPTMTGEYFKVSLTAINWLANVQCVVYVIMSFFTGFIFEKLGVKRSVTLYTNIPNATCKLNTRKIGHGCWISLCARM